MSGICDKCNTKHESGAIFVEAGQLFMFCKACSDLLDGAPTGNTIHKFMGPKVENWVSKNIRSARLRRQQGIRMWPDKDQCKAVLHDGC